MKRAALDAGDRVEQVLVVAHRKIGAPDRSLEQHVAHLGEPRLAVEEDDVSGRVARTMNYFEPQFTHFILLTIGPVVIGNWWILEYQAECFPL